MNDKKWLYVLNLLAWVFFLSLLSFSLLHSFVGCCALPLLPFCSWSWSLVCPLRYFCPVRKHESCLALTTNASPASFVVPLVKYFWHIFNQTAVARMQVGPFLGDLTIPGASSLGRTMLSIFCSVISAVVFTLGSSIGLRYQAGTFTCTGDHFAAFRTMSKVYLLAILPSDEMFPHAILM